jgi:hypothetical protein
VIIQKVSKLAAERLSPRGDLTIFVNVNSKGEETGVRIIQYDYIDFAKAVSYVLVPAKYKPAICCGKPCKLEFPFRLAFK